MNGGYSRMERSIGKRGPIRERRHLWIGRYTSVTSNSVGITGSWNLVWDYVILYCTAQSTASSTASISALHCLVYANNRGFCSLEQLYIVR